VSGEPGAAHRERLAALKFEQVDQPLDTHPGKRKSRRKNSSLTIKLRRPRRTANPAAPQIRNSTWILLHDNAVRSANSLIERPARIARAAAQLTAPAQSARSLGLDHQNQPDYQPGKASAPLQRGVKPHSAKSSEFHRRREPEVVTLPSTAAISLPIRRCSMPSPIRFPPALRRRFGSDPSIAAIHYFAPSGIRIIVLLETRIQRETVHESRR
jgi:hypothetical protein